MGTSLQRTATSARSPGARPGPETGPFSRIIGDGRS